MTQKLTIHIPGQPAPKARPRVFRGRAVTPKRTAEYEARVQGHALLARQRGRWDGLLASPLSITMEFRLARKGGRVPDLDNLVKAVIDGMQGVIYRDDVCIWKLTASREIVSEHQGVGVTVTVERTTRGHENT